MQEIINYIAKNREWIFSGIGVVSLTALFWLVRSMWNKTQSRKERTQKELSFEVVASTSMLDVAERVQEKVKVTFLEKPVSRIHFVLLKVINSGNAPITSSDFDEEVSFSFGDNTDLLDVDLAVKNPPTLKAEIKRQPKGFSLSPTLLNPDDSITVSILLGEFDGRIDVRGRIVGVREIKELTDFSYDESDNPLNRGLLISAFGSGIMAGDVMAGGLNGSIWPFLFGGVLTVFGIMLIAANLQKKRDKMREMIKANKWDDLTIVTPTKVFVPNKVVEQTTKAQKRLNQ